jgi:transposase
MQTIAMICQGMSNPQIAKVMGCGLETIRSNVHRISERTGMESKRDIAFWAAHKGIGGGYARRDYELEKLDEAWHKEACSGKHAS